MEVLKYHKGSCISNIPFPALSALVFSCTTQPEQNENPTCNSSSKTFLSVVKSGCCCSLSLQPLEDGRKDLGILVRAWCVLPSSGPWRLLITSTNEPSMPGAEPHSGTMLFPPNTLNSRAVSIGLFPQEGTVRAGESHLTHSLSSGCTGC